MVGTLKQERTVLKCNVYIFIEHKAFHSNYHNSIYVLIYTAWCLDLTFRNSLYLQMHHCV